MKQPQQMNVYARFVSEEPRTEAQPPATKARRAAARVTAGGQSPKPGLKKRASLPK